jgi:ADP-ribose pyrophosphatase
MEILDRKVVYRTPYCSLVAKTVSGQNGAPYFGVDLPDYVTVVALNERREILLVRQFRPVVERMTLELPSGCLEPNEPPLECARRELLEETGYEANELFELGWLLPDTGRLANRLGCYFAENIRLADPPPAREEGLELVLCPLEKLADWILSGRIEHALHLAVIHLAMLRHKLPFAA